MTPDQITSELINKQFYKFTGPPENWLTALKFTTWGLEEKYRDQWNHILPGDIFLMHSTSTNTRVHGATSAIIGFGVVASNLREKQNLLWLQEIENNFNKWPLLIPFSEIYLFSPYFETHQVIEPTLSNLVEITTVSRNILKDSIPLSLINSFPQMGSFSSVRPEVVNQIFSQVQNLYVISSPTVDDYAPTPLLEMTTIKDQTRYGTTLQLLNSIKRKTRNASSPSSFNRDPVLLERAEEAHQSTLEKLMKLLKSNGYDTYFNKHVDLFATNKKQSYLFEVKSNENKNFISQSRKGIVQLFEYEYFEIKKFFRDANQDDLPIYKNITLSQAPQNTTYINFMNHLDLGVCLINDDRLEAVGKAIGIDKI